MNIRALDKHTDPLRLAILMHHATALHYGYSSGQGSALTLFVLIQWM